MGFTDDIVVRAAEADSGSRIDVRSASRHGRSDLGVNAARIRTYLAAVLGRAFVPGVLTPPRRLIFSRPA